MRIVHPDPFHVHEWRVTPLTSNTTNALMLHCTGCIVRALVPNRVPIEIPGGMNEGPVQLCRHCTEPIEPWSFGENAKPGPHFRHADGSRSCSTLAEP